MKLKSSQLRKRLIKSLSFGILFFVVLSFAFQKVKYYSEDEDVSPILKKVLKVNGDVWASVFSQHRLSPALPPPPRGRPPRQNGDLGLNSELDLTDYRVQIESGEKKLSLPMSAFQSLPKSGYSTLFKCVEGWSETIQYSGVRFSDFMKAYQVGQKPDGSYYRYVGLETPDQGYYVSIDMDSMMHPQTLLAYEMNEAPIDAPNGAPIRLIIPIKYGIKSIKRIGRIFFSDERPRDYWNEQGYDWWAGL